MVDAGAGTEKQRGEREKERENILEARTFHDGMLETGQAGGGTCAAKL